MSSSAQQSPLETRVELLEKATLTVIHNQDEMKSQFAGLQAEIAEIKNIVQLILQTVNARLPPEKKEE